ncbi:MAG: REP-associated tyrosine transposase [Bdellovibrio bacteriovorus]
MSYNDLREGRFSEPGREYLVTTVVRGRTPWFRDFGAARACIRQLPRVEGETGARWLAWVLMPDHFHGLVGLGDAADLATLMRLLKGASAHAVNQVRGRSGPIWQPSYYDRALRRDEDRVAAARYIVANPLRAGLVSRLGDYPHWDSVWL